MDGDKWVCRLIKIEHEFSWKAAGQTETDTMYFCMLDFSFPVWGENQPWESRSIECQINIEWLWRWWIMSRYCVDKYHGPADHDHYFPGGCRKTNNTREHRWPRYNRQWWLRYFRGDHRPSYFASRRKIIEFDETNEVFQNFGLTPPLVPTS